MFKRMFGRREAEPSPIPAIHKINETVQLLEKKDKLLQKKILAESEKAKQFVNAKNKKAAIQCLKRKKLYEAQVEQLGDSQMRLHDQIIMLESSTLTIDTFAALRTGAAAIKSMQNSVKINDVNKVMDELSEQTESIKGIQQALASTSLCADFDEDELDAELEELEEADKEPLEKPNPPLPFKHASGEHVEVPPMEKAPRQLPSQTNEEDELAKLQAEMTL